MNSLWIPARHMMIQTHIDEEHGMSFEMNQPWALMEIDQGSLDPEQPVAAFDLSEFLRTASQPPPERGKGYL